MKRTLGQAAVLLLVSAVLGFARSWVPGGIAWNGRWPTSSTSAEEAFKMMAKPGDAPFASLQDAIDLQRDPKVIFLDARSPEEFEKGRIAGARPLPYYQLMDYQERALNGASADTVMVIYCEGIGCELSFFLARELQSAGYKNLRIFYGGYPEWQSAGLPIEK